MLYSVDQACQRFSGPESLQTQEYVSLLIEPNMVTLAQNCYVELKDITFCTIWRQQSFKKGRKVPETVRIGHLKGPFVQITRRSSTG